MQKRPISKLWGIVFVAACTLLPGPGRAVEPEVNEYLDMDITQLLNIMVTSASKRAQSLSEVPAAIFVITQEDIRRSGVTSIPEALAMAPGIQVSRINGYRWSVSSRGFSGFNSTKLLILIDGRSLYSPGYSGTFWDSQNTMLEDIDRIEVIRGPGATVWGANAVNGIINIITKKAKDTQGTLVRVGAGSRGMFTSAARYGGQLNETTHGRFYLSYDDYPGNTLATPDFTTGSSDAHDDWRPAQGGFRIDGTPNDRAEWTVQGDLLVNKEDMLVSPYWLDHSPYRSSLYQGATLTRSNLLGRWQQELGGGRALTLQSYIDQSRYDVDGDSFEQDFNTLDVDLQYETPVGSRQHLSLGAGYRLTEIDFTSTPFIGFPDRDDCLYSAFVQDEINLLADTLWLTLGTKYEHNDYSGSELQPSAKLLWKPMPRHSLWASVARAVRTPTPLEQEGHLTVGTYPTPWGDGRASLLGTSGFDSETVVAYETGYRWQATETLSLDLALFLNDYDKLYSFSDRPAWPDYDVFFINGMAGTGYGVETSVDWKAASWLSFILSYSYLELDLHRIDSSGREDLVDFFEDLSPAHQISFRSSVSLARDWQLNLWLRYVGQTTGRDGNNLLDSPKITVDGYTVFNANLIWTPLPTLEVMLSGQNLFNASQLEYTMEYVVPPTEIERSIYGKITWRF
ncbi:MAG: TonB-dependent receptor plug domain-containing protein [Desulfobulbus sp.]